MSLNALPSEIHVEIFALISNVSAALSLSLVNRHMHHMWKTMASRLIKSILLREMTYSEQALRLVSIQELIQQPGTVYDVNGPEQTLTKPQAYKKLRQLNVNGKDSKRADQLFRSWENNHPSLENLLGYEFGVNSADFYNLQSFIIARRHPDITSQLGQEVIDVAPRHQRKMFWVLGFFLDPQAERDTRFGSVRLWLFDQHVPPHHMTFASFVTIHLVDWVMAFSTLTLLRCRSG